MERGRLNAWIVAGLLLNTTAILLNRFFALPDALSGVLIGMALSFMFVGLAAHTGALKRVSAFKRRLFKR